MLSQIPVPLGRAAAHFLSLVGQSSAWLRVFFVVGWFVPYPPPPRNPFPLVYFVILNNRERVLFSPGGGRGGPTTKHQATQFEKQQLQSAALIDVRENHISTLRSFLAITVPPCSFRVPIHLPKGVPDWTGRGGAGLDGTGRYRTGRGWTGLDGTGRDGTGLDGRGVQL